MSEQTNEQLLLIEQLSSDKRSLRIQAVVKLSRIGKTEAALEALSNLASKGDREESFFASQAIAKISQKLSSRAPKSVETPVESVSEDTQINKENHRFISNDFLSVDKDKAPALLHIIRTQPEQIPEDVLPSVGVFLGKYGDVSDSEFIQNYLINHQDNLTLPYISAAEKIDSKILYPVLPYLLASKESLVRSRAVMALRKIDQTEAERHFLHFLASTKAEDRLAALEISFLFPFDRVKSYIIALLQEEKDTDVFKACATVLASNPSLEIALRILDVLESASPEQRKPITALFNIVSAAIKSAKVLPPQEATPQALVSTWKQQRLKKFLNDLEIQLCTTTGPKREAIINWIDKNKSIPDVAEFLDKLALNPQTEDVYQRLTGNSTNDEIVLPSIDTLFENTSKTVSSVPSKAPKKVEIQKSQDNTISKQKILDNNQSSSLPSLESVQHESQQSALNVQPQSQEAYAQEAITNEQTVPSLVETQDANKGKAVISEERKQVLRLKRLEMQQFMEEKHKIAEMAEDTSISPAIRAEALNLLLKFAPSVKIKSLGINAIEETDSRLQTVGFKILERVAPEKLKAKLPDLLLSSDTNIRVRAIRFGLKVDSNQAIQALEKLISSKDQNHRSYAVSCLALCPFESVYLILIKTLRVEQHPLVAKQITAILLSNPDSNILAALDKISSKITEPSIEMIISQTRNELEEILNTLPESQRKSKLEPIKLNGISTESEESKPYSVENVRKIAKEKNLKKTETKNESFSTLALAFLASIVNNPVNLAVALLIIVVFFGSIIALSREDKPAPVPRQKQSTRSSERNNSKNKNSKIPTTFRMNKPCTISGNVANIISESSIVINHSGREIMVKFKGKEAKEIKKGDNVSVTCIPYRENPNGIILSNGTKISKI
ncbi:MAG: hypothetical protein II567_08765 [Candidatus Riflebacteria bacterium]|nr:hypothetical protein [Candidatus Riflebacteria bacterium]